MVAGAEECGAGAGKDLRRRRETTQQRTTTTTDNTQQSNRIRWR
jgi:hypothetical protein